MTIGAMAGVSPVTAYVPTETVTGEVLADDGETVVLARRRKRRDRSPDGWSPGGFGQQAPGANLPPNHPMHPNNRRMSAVAGAEMAIEHLGSTPEGEVVLVSRRRRRRRRSPDGWSPDGFGQQQPGANLPPSHPMHPSNRNRRWNV